MKVKTGMDEKTEIPEATQEDIDFLSMMRQREIEEPVRHFLFLALEKPGQATQYMKWLERQERVPDIRELVKKAQEIRFEKENSKVKT